MAAGRSPSLGLGSPGPVPAPSNPARLHAPWAALTPKSKSTDPQLWEARQGSRPSPPCRQAADTSSTVMVNPGKDEHVDGEPLSHESDGPSTDVKGDGKVEAVGHSKAGSGESEMRRMTRRTVT